MENMVAWNDYKAEAKSRGALAYELYTAISMPTGDPAAVRAVLQDHLAYIRQLEVGGQLVMAGPLSDESGEEMIGAGQIVLRANSLEEARSLADGDPMHSSGARAYTMRKWLINEGNLKVSIGLSTGEISLK